MENDKLIENDILFSYLEEFNNTIKKNLILEISKDLPDSYIYTSFTWKELINYLQKTWLMYLEWYLESVEKEFSCLDRNSLYEKDEVLFIMNNNEIVWCAAIKIDPNGSWDDTVAWFSFVDIREYDRRQWLAKFLVKQRFEIVKNKFPNVNTIIVSSFSDLWKNLVSFYKAVSKDYSYNILVSNPWKEKVLLDNYIP